MINCILIKQFIQTGGENTERRRPDASPDNMSLLRETLHV